jgi:hypothetical protein
MNYPKRYRVEPPEAYSFSTKPLTLGGGASEEHAGES